MKIEIGCYCGNEIKTNLEARHDFGMDGEDMKTETVKCPLCGMTALVHISVSVSDYGKQLP